MTLLVVGGGYIGLELGSVYAALGTRVYRGRNAAGLAARRRSRPGPAFAQAAGKDCSKESCSTRRSLPSKTRGTESAPRSKARTSRSARRFSIRVSFRWDASPTRRFQDSTRRTLRSDSSGFIQVNKQLQTDDPSIYAIGDVVGEPMLAHKASHEGRVAVEAIAGHKVAFEPNAIPAVVFTDPEIAWAGLTETQAQKENREIKVAKFPWAASGRAVTLDRPEGLTKLLIDPKLSACWESGL